MERLTYDFALGGNHCWQVKGADNLECREVCERQGDDGCKTCPIAKAFDRHLRRACGQVPGMPAQLFAIWFYAEIWRAWNPFLPLWAMQ